MISSDLTTEEAASTLRLNKATVQRMLKTGRLKGYQIGRSWRVTEAALNELRGNRINSVGSQKHNTAPLQSVSVTDDYDTWERLLLNDDNKASAPSISAEAMRRETMYEGRD